MKFMANHRLPRFWAHALCSLEVASADPCAAGSGMQGRVCAQPTFKRINALTESPSFILHLWPMFSPKSYTQKCPPFPPADAAFRPCVSFKEAGPNSEPLLESLTFCEGRESQGLDPRGFVDSPSKQWQIRTHSGNKPQNWQIKTTVDKSGHVETNPDKQKQIQANIIFDMCL